MQGHVPQHGAAGTSVSSTTRCRMSRVHSHLTALLQATLDICIADSSDLTLFGPCTTFLFVLCYMSTK